MGKPDKLKTAKICIAAVDMTLDGYQTKKDIKKAQRKERQKGKKEILKSLKDYNLKYEKN